MRTANEALHRLLAEIPLIAFASNYANSSRNPKMPSLGIRFGAEVDAARARQAVEVFVAAVKARLAPWRGEQLRARRITDRAWVLELDALWDGDADEDMGDAVCEIAELVQAHHRN